MKIVEKHNYNPNNIAKSLKNKKSNMIGVLMEDIKYFYVPELINTINEYCENNGYFITLGNLCLDRKIGVHYEDAGKHSKIINEHANALIAKQVDGIIYIGGAARDLSGLLDNKLPTAYVYAFSKDSNTLSVIYDDETAAYDATSLLIDYGHTEIGMIGGPSNWGHQHERLRGYKRALLKRRLVFRKDRIFNGDWSMQSGYDCAIKMLSRDRPSAVFCCNDQMAAGLYHAARELFISIPEELSVIGFDNKEICETLYPALTSVDLPIRSMGAICAQQMIRLIETKENHTHNIIMLPCKLRARESIQRFR